MGPRLISAALLAALTLSAEDELPKQKETVVVTGSYEPLPLGEADRSVRAISARELAPLTGTISDLLNLDSSVDMRERAPGGVQSGVSIRGGSFGQTLVLWNGMRLNSMQTSNLNMDVPVPLDALSQVEVLKGSGSTLYGSDATAGVVNFITRPPEHSEVRLRAGLGNWGTQQQRASLAYVSGKLAQQLTMSRDFSTGFLPNRDYRNLSVASTTVWKQTEVNLAINDRPYGAEQFYGNYNSWERTKNWFAGARQRIGDKTEAAFAYRRHTDLFVLYRDRPQVYTNRHIMETYQAQLRRREDLPKSSRLHYGAEFLYDSINSNNLGVHSRGRSAAYAAWDVRALNRFSFTVGLRDEIYRNFQHQFNPSVGAGFWLHRHWKLRGSASRAFRLPTYTDLYYRDPGNVGNPLLRPETAWSYEGGLDWNAGGAWRATVTVFQRREKDGIDYVRNSPADIWQATNFQSLHFTGVEASVSTTVRRRHRIEFSYTGLNGAQSVLGAQQSKYVFNYPKHSGLASWQAAMGKGFVARSRVGAMERLGRSPYTVWDIFSSWQKGYVQPYVQFTNLTAANYQEVIGIQMPGRGILGGVEIVFHRR
ncbi:MAG TPA: TonB-dependent receptor [Bryobacteraceae bacterium]|nr:TonB-dependent receptor [Bryobacteraceae bacterium]